MTVGSSTNETPRDTAPAPGAAPPPFLNLRGVRKRLGATEALRGIDLDAGRDELLVVLGPTGAGKTTLLRTIAGLEQPDAGTITMAGRDVTALDPASRDVALVFQNFSLYPRWSVRRNLEFPLRAPGRNVPEAEIQSRVAWAADLLRITRFLDREASRLSGGEMQRVAIGRAIVRRPRLFLMDEPLTNLDAKLREALRVELVELRRELKTPMVFVTHDQAEALSMADRIVVLSEGRILQTGAPREIYERPASPVVALQLGQPAINLVPVRREGGQWRAADGTPLSCARRRPAPASACSACARRTWRCWAARRHRKRWCASSSTPGRRPRCWSIGSGRASTSWSRAGRPCARAIACIPASTRDAPFFSSRRQTARRAHDRAILSSRSS